MSEYSYNSDELIVAVVITALIAMMLFTVWYSYHLRLRPGKALPFAALVQAAGTLCLLVTELRVVSGTPLLLCLPRSPMIGLLAAAAFLGLMGFGVGLLAKVYRACVMEIATDAERLPGAKLLRAWLGPMNLVTAMGTVLGGYYALGWSPAATSIAALALLLAFPLLNSLGGKAVAGEPDASAEERRRVLALVETGKVSAEDGAELLAALSQSHASAVPDEQGGISGNRRLMLAGAAILLVGFFLPWLTVHWINSVTESHLPQGISQLLNVPFPPPVPVNLEVDVRGGDLSYGLGWFILLLGIGTAVLPLVWPTRPANRQAQRSLSLVALGAGSLLVLYVFSGYLTTKGLELKVGLILTLLGYAILWAGGTREYTRHPQHAALSSAAVAQ